ncbi:MAG: hypothetical protein MUP76_10645 [Acidimicrobiia bacterium]|nr:hypothetical protein [Acidimicrobiia bacterium]
MTDRSLGRIVLIQIQRSMVKFKGVRYDPAPLLAVSEAAIGPLGITGVHDGAHVMEVHHAAHPSQRGGGNRTLSMGFTGHYELMAARFGEVPVGIGGENLIVEYDGRLFDRDLAGDIVILSGSGEVVLRGARDAAPCREFTSFLLGRDEVADREEVAEELEFLSRGMRGFILDGSALERPMSVHLGDEVVLRG